MYALALLGFMCNKHIVLAIFFTFKVSAKVIRVLKNQLYTDLCIVMLCFQFYYLFVMIDVEIVYNLSFLAHLS